MAIKIQGVEVIDDDRSAVNVEIIISYINRAMKLPSGTVLQWPN